MVVRAVDSSVAGVTDSDMVNQSDVRVIMEHESVRRVVWRQYLGSSYAEKNRNHHRYKQYNWQTERLHDSSRIITGGPTKPINRRLVQHHEIFANGNASQA